MALKTCLAPRNRHRGTLPFWDGVVSAFTDLKSGIQNVGESTISGIGNLAGEELSKQVTLNIQLHREQQWEMIKWMAIGRKESVREIISKVLDLLDAHVPECVKQEVYKRILSRLGGRTVGNIAVNQLAQKILEAVANIATPKFVVRLGKLGKASASGVIFGYQLLGISQEMVESSEKLERKHPKIYTELDKLNHSHYFYLFAEEAMDEIGEILKMSEEEIIKEYKTE